MTLEKNFQLTLPEPPEHLLKPERVFGGRPPFGRLERQGSQLRGELVAEVPLLGEIHFPFQSRIDAQEEGRAYLLADSPTLTLDQPRAMDPPSSPPSPADQQRAEPADPRFWAELEGEGWAVEDGICYKLRLRIHAEIPQGEKWGGKALRRMAEAAFERTVSRALEGLQGGKLLRG
ncbi:MAG: DUF3809 domain-containing protein [Meiothermus sp.]